MSAPSFSLPPCGGGLGWGGIVSETITPHPQPLPRKGGGEKDASGAKL
jgi:hypothetical protein